MRGWLTLAAGTCLLLSAGGCASSNSVSSSQTLTLISSPPVPAPADDHQALEVTATAYNSLHGQGSGDPTLAAWGDRLKPGMKAIAVSRDLLELGLTHGAEVEIDGMPGRWTVRDKMAKRWKRRIDLYMGVDRDAALKWGRQAVTIRWKPRKH